MDQMGNGYCFQFKFSELSSASWGTVRCYKIDAEKKHVGTQTFFKSPYLLYLPHTHTKLHQVSTRENFHAHPSLYKAK